ncbi:MAG: undecaprenyl diphosphate synthase family protein [Methanotrichaceae archaeon]
MLDHIYEKQLEKQISRENVPQCIAIVFQTRCAGGWKKVCQLIEWSRSVGVRNLILCAEKSGPDMPEDLMKELAVAPAKISVYTSQGETKLGKGGPVELAISLGYGGKQEVTGAIKELLNDVKSGLVDPKDINEKMIESKLRFKQRPDLMIRVGEKRLSNFLIWQSSYSELYFIKSCWENLKKIEFLRAIMSYQQRNRRFGR